MLFRNLPTVSQYIVEFLSREDLVYPCLFGGGNVLSVQQQIPQGSEGVFLRRSGFFVGFSCG